MEIHVQKTEKVFITKKTLKRLINENISSNTH